MTDVDALIVVYTSLKNAGFTGIVAKRAPLPQNMAPPSLSRGETLKSLGDRDHYCRVTTDQGEFGIWTEPYFGLDLHGTGLNWGDLGYSDFYKLPSELHEVAAITDASTLLLLWQKLAQRKLKP
ncbi:MAG: hypothetical protein AAB797_01600 [Patescibacteria group bacterium]